MKFFSLNKPKNTPLKAGTLLVAEPFLDDLNFFRTVVFICDHSAEGSVGFILNRRTRLTLGDLFPKFYASLLHIFQGGPVQMETLHMLHRAPDKFGGNEISPGVFWGGSYEALQEVVLDHTYESNDIRLFAGYAGWSPGQLDQEIEDGSWMVVDVHKHLLFDTEASEIWKASITTMGEEYTFLANLPMDPQLN